MTKTRVIWLSSYKCSLSLVQDILYFSAYSQSHHVRGSPFKFPSDKLKRRLRVVAPCHTMCHCHCAWHWIAPDALGRLAKFGGFHWPKEKQNISLIKSSWHLLKPHEKCGAKLLWKSWENIATIVKITSCDRFQKYHKLKLTIQWKTCIG